MLAGPHVVGALRWQDGRAGLGRGAEVTGMDVEGSSEQPRPAFGRRRRRANVEGGRTGNHRVKTSPAEEALLVQLALAQGGDGAAAVGGVGAGW